MARMAGKTKPRANCRVPGHGDRCSVAVEVQERSVGRAAEKRAWMREAVGDGAPKPMAVMVSIADRDHIDALRHRSAELAVARGHVVRS